MYSGVVVDAGRITDMPLTLKLDAVSETVHVSADATPLAARDAHLRVVVGRLRQRRDGE